MYYKSIFYFLWIFQVVTFIFDTRIKENDELELELIFSFTKNKKKLKF